MIMRSPESTPSEPPFAPLFAAEDRHFWFRARARLLRQVFGRLSARLTPGYRVLEVGCGTGNVLRELEQVCLHGEVMGMDLFEQGLSFAQRRTRCPLIQADIHHMSFDKPFDLIGMFDVLEHLPDDRRALQDLRGTLQTGGRLVLTVPAHMCLWSHTDEFAEHYRRYSPKGLRTLLSECGYHVEHVTQFMMALFPLMWLGRRVARWLGKPQPDALQKKRDLTLGELRVVPILNGLLRCLLEWEAPLLTRGFRLPLGTSLLAIASRKEPHEPPLAKCA
jgi:SAM-dependent methyltransferase